MQTYHEVNLFLSDKIHGSFSEQDMMALETGLLRLKPGDTYVEIGTQYGRSIYFAHTRLPEGVKMYTVDIEDHEADPRTLSRAEFWKLAKLDRVEFIYAPSVEAAVNFRHTIQMMFIDANHNYKSVESDLEAWYPHVEHGGYIYFHDVDITSPGVVRLLRELESDKRFDEVTYYKETLGVQTSIASVRKI